MLPKIMTDKGNFIYDREIVEAVLEAHHKKMDIVVIDGKKVRLALKKDVKFPYGDIVDVIEIKVEDV